jgi:hypothetical protein
MFDITKEEDDYEITGELNKGPANTKKRFARWT